VAQVSTRVVADESRPPRRAHRSVPLGDGPWTERSAGLPLAGLSGGRSPCAPASSSAYQTRDRDAEFTRWWLIIPSRRLRPLDPSSCAVLQFAGSRLLSVVARVDELSPQALLAAARCGCTTGGCYARSGLSPRS